MGLLKQCDRGVEVMKKTQLRLQRFTLGLICGLLPILDIVFGLVYYKHIPQSISVTYYYNFNVIMIGALILCSFFLFTYKGYDLGDRIFTVLAGIGSLGVAVFPMTNIFADGVKVGLFSLPDNISNVIHLISAILVFGSFGLMTFTQFTKGKHKYRNILYYICGGVILLTMLIMGLSSFVSFLQFEASTMIYELIMLEAFAIAWLTKSGIFFKK